MEDKELIYLVDDQVATLHTVAEMLKGLYRLKPFNSGKTMLECYENETPDLIILDYEMPEMNGLDVFEILNISQSVKKIPVIFLTGSVNADIEAELLEKGASDFIHKPIKSQVLLARIRTQLELANYHNYMESTVAKRTSELRIANELLTVKEDIILSLLAKTIDLRNNDDGSMSKRTTEMVKILVNDILQNPYEDYTLSQAEADQIIKTAKLHDIGNIGLPDRIINKRDNLTNEEFMQYKYHTICGTMLFDEYINQLRGDNLLTTARDIAMCHHEKWVGGGYPYGTQGKAIPLSARIAAIAIEYNNQVSSNSEVSSKHDTAVKMIKDESGKMFDPYLVEVFLKHEQQFKALVPSDKSQNSK